MRQVLLRVLVLGQEREHSVNGPHSLNWAEGESDNLIIEVSSLYDEKHDQISDMNCLDMKERKTVHCMDRMYGTYLLYTHAYELD